MYVSERAIRDNTHGKNVSFNLVGNHRRRVNQLQSKAKEMCFPFMEFGHPTAET